MTMRRVALSLVALFSCSVFAQQYPSLHYVVISDLNTGYVDILTRNMEAFYENMLGGYFEQGWQQPLTIYYFEKQSDTQAYLGGAEKIYYGIYIPSKNAIFTHRIMDDGSLAGLGTLFHEITHHFVRINYTNPPSWFDEGLTSFLSEQTRIVNGKVSLGHPNPWREQALRDMIESGAAIDVRYYTSLNGEKFYADRKNYHPLRALFYWMYMNGRLKAYMANVKQQGYALSVLEQTTGKNADQISIELLAFIRKNGYAGAYVQDSLRASNAENKKRLLSAALNLMPDYSRARYDLALLLYREQDYAGCQRELEVVLKDTHCIEYKDASRLMGDYRYKEKNIQQALIHYQNAFNAAAYDEYQYEICYNVAACYMAKGDKEQARVWLKDYLAKNWEPQTTQKSCKSAKDYLEQNP
ncbi:MAG: hypothetical protein ABFD91_07555 [Anaerohalosphaeraceae bacterium]